MPFYDTARCETSSESMISQTTSLFPLYVCKVVHGYQILTIDFAKTRGMSGWVKRKGAVSTQRIPAFSSLFDVSSGVSGATDTSSMDPGTAYSARVATPDGLDLVRVSGVLQPIQTNEDARLCEFVVCNAHTQLAVSRCLLLCATCVAHPPNSLTNPTCLTY